MIIALARVEEPMLLELDILPKTAISIPVVKKVTLLLYASSPNLSFSQ